MKTRAITAAFGSALLFGASTPASKLLLGNVSPLMLAALLYLGAAVGVAPFALRDLPKVRLSRRSTELLLASVVFGGIAGPIVLLWGLSLSPAGSVSLWLNLETVATVLLAWAFFKEHVGMRVWLALLLIVAAGFALAWPFTPTSLLAVAAVAFACFCWGIDNNVTALIDGLTPAQSTFVKGIVAGGFNLAAAFWLGDAAPKGVTALAGMGVGAFGYGLSIALYISSAQRLGAVRSQAIFMTAPFLGLLIAWFAVGEAVLPNQLMAAGMMVFGLMLLLSGRHGHAHSHEAVEHVHSHRHDDGHHSHVHPGLPAWIQHTHPHRHEALTHTHEHEPDLHHRHRH